MAGLIVVVRLIRQVNPNYGITSRTRTEEVEGCNTGRRWSGHEDFGHPLEDELHMQLSVLAQLDGTTITDAIRQAIEAYVERLGDSDELSTKAQAMLEEVERDAESRRAAITALLSKKQPTGEATTGTSRSSRRSSRQEKSD